MAKVTGNKPGDFDDLHPVANDIFTKVDTLAATRPNCTIQLGELAFSDSHNLTPAQQMQYNLKRGAELYIHTIAGAEQLRWRARYNAAKDAIPPLLAAGAYTNLQYNLSDDRCTQLEVNYTWAQLQAGAPSCYLTIMRTDAHIKQQLDIRRYSDGELSTKKTTSIAHDSLVAKAALLLRADRLSMHMVAAGLLPQHLLEPTLARITERHKGTPTEHDVAALLQELRNRYYAARDAKEMEWQLGTNEVTVQDLIELRNLLLTC